MHSSPIKSQTKNDAIGLNGVAGTRKEQTAPGAQCIGGYSIEQEADSITATLTFLNGQTRFWQRDNYIGHLTASAWVVNAARSHVHRS